VRKKVRIWSKIFFIVLVALVPTVVLTIYTAFSFRSRLIMQSSAELSRLCEVYLNEHRLIVQNAYQMLLSISRTPTIQQRDYTYLNTYLRDLMDLNGRYAVILVADENGMVLASGIEATGYSIGDREYFNRAVASGAFTVGTFLISRSTGIPSITYSLPVRDLHNHTVILIATFSLEQYFESLSLSNLSRDSVLEIFDANGKRLFSNDDVHRFLFGEPVDVHLYTKALRNNTGDPEVFPINGVPHLVSLNSLMYNGQAVYVSVRRPYRMILDESTRPVIRTLIVMLAGLVSA